MTEQRFWSKVNKTDTCWLWTGCCFSNGYGAFGVNSNNVGAHRYSYMLHKGEIAEGLVIRHTCDVRVCVNPNHLIIGTLKDNINDMVERNRQAKGINCCNTKLTEDDIREIRIFRGFGFKYDKLANMYGVDKTTIGRIITGKTWSHV